MEASTDSVPLVDCIVGVVGRLVASVSVVVDCPSAVGHLGGIWKCLATCLSNLPNLSLTSRPGRSYRYDSLHHGKASTRRV